MIFVAHRINTVNELKMVPFKFGIEVDVTNYADKLVLAHCGNKDPSRLYPINPSTLKVEQKNDMRF